jgi:fructose-bisphosphate aldolase class I
MTEDLSVVAATLAAASKGILAADETPATLTRRFEALGIASTPASRCAYREMLFATPGLAEFISGAILQDETVRQGRSDGAPIMQGLAARGILPGVKVDSGAKPLAGFPGETVTEGLDGLRERLAEYRSLGAVFAKWRAVIRLGDAQPSGACIAANAHALARYAALCQEQGIVPIVEPEVLMDGAHALERCEAVTGSVLAAVFTALDEQGVRPEGMLLKPNMVVAGHDHPQQPDARQVAVATLRCLRRHVPAAVPGVVFLSGGQAAQTATRHLDAINRLDGPKPWTLTFSFGRALQDPALEAWGGRSENVSDAQRALLRRARCNAAASLGAYRDDMEAADFTARPAPGRREQGRPTHH